MNNINKLLYFIEKWEWERVKAHMCCYYVVEVSFYMLSSGYILPVPTIWETTNVDTGGNRQVWRTEGYETYVFMKKPASERHFTFVPMGRRFLKLSQWRITASPPAEHPDSIACVHMILTGLSKLEKAYIRRRNHHTFSASFSPFANRSFITARNTLAPL